MEANPVPVKFTKPNAKTSSSQTKFNLVPSRGWLNQVLRNVNSSLKRINQRNPNKIKPGNISVCIFADKFGIKKAKGAKITFMVIDREAMGTKMPIAFVGGPSINSLYSCLSSQSMRSFRKTAIESKFIIVNTNIIPIKGTYKLVCPVDKLAQGISDSLINPFP
jgi:hypothetical protein